MELKNCIEFVVVKQDRTYRFSVPSNAPYGETYDVAFDVLNKIREMSQEAADLVKRNSQKENDGIKE